MKITFIEQLTGEFKDGNMHGKGTYYYANGDKYTGDWVDDHETGEGVFIWADGERYEGNYSEMLSDH